MDACRNPLRFRKLKRKKKTNKQTKRKGIYCWENSTGPTIRTETTAVFSAVN